MTTVPPTVPPPAPPPVYAAAPPPPQKSSGCLKWGLIGCGVVIVLGVIFGVVVMAGVFGLMKKTDVYKEARHRAENDPRVIAVLGSPITAGWLVTGSVHTDTNTGGNAELNFTVSGPNGSAKVHVVATRQNDEWKYEEMTATPDKGPPIDLLTQQ